MNTRIDILNATRIRDPKNLKDLQVKLLFNNKEIAQLNKRRQKIKKSANQITLKSI